MRSVFNQKAHNQQKSSLVIWPHTHMHARIHTHTCIHIHTHSHTQTHTHTNTHRCTNAHVHTYTSAYTHTCTYTYTCAHAYIHTHTHTCAHTHMYIIHGHTWKHLYIKHSCIIFPQVTARAFIAFQQFLTRLQNKTGICKQKIYMVFIICDASDEFLWKLMTHETLYYAFYYVTAHYSLATK